MCNSRYMLFRFSVSWTLLKILTLCKQQMHLLFCFRLIRIFGFAEDTHAQQNLNKFSFVFDLFVSLPYVTVSDKLSRLRVSYPDVAPSAELSGNRLP